MCCRRQYLFDKGRIVIPNRIAPPRTSWATSLCGQRPDAPRRKEILLPNNKFNSMAGHSRPRNIILAQLPEVEYAALMKFAVPVDLPLGKPLSEPNQPIEYVYFPNSGLISTDALTEKGESVEVGVIGREGFSGLPALFDQPQMSHAVLMQGSGEGIRIPSSIVREEFQKSRMLQRRVHTFAYLQLVQVTQSVLCNRMHEVEARLARWLLTSADRMESDSLHLTQEFLAQMLGVQRSTVTVAAGELQKEGLIGYSRGKIDILKRTKLVKRACECYLIVRSSYDRVLRINSNGSSAYVD
jgi:CRP-like cAMP-binding protein